MGIEFKYFLDSKTGQVSLSFTRGTLNEEQQNNLLEEIAKQRMELMLNGSGYFIPQSPIIGLPEDISFKYVYTQISPTSRSVLINMSCEDPTPPVIQEQRANDLLHTSEKIDQHDWTNLFMNSLVHHLNDLPCNTTTEKEAKEALNYTITELRYTLENNNDKHNTLLLFKSYLQFSAAQLSPPLNEEKATRYLLAFHLINSKEDLWLHENKTAATNLTDERKSLFAKITRLFFFE
ncbi:MAG: hypothetical protein WCL60_14120 [Methylococcales bacterium]